MAFRNSLLLAPPLALALLCGCSGADSGSKAPSSIAKYGPAAQSDLTPYPSDRYTVPDPSTPTGLRVDITSAKTADQLVAAYPDTAKELDAMDGFSTTGGVLMEFTSPIDPTGLVDLPDADPPVTGAVLDANDYKKPDSPLLLVNVDPESKDQGKPVGLIPTWWEQAKDDFYTTDEFTLIAQPAVPLTPGTRYAFVATKKLHAKNGTPVGRSKDMDALIHGKSGDAYGKEISDALDVIENSVGVARGDVVCATVFTTATVKDGIIAMAKAARAAPPPAQGDPWSLVKTDKTEVRFRATFAAPEFRKARPAGQPLAFDDGKWQTGKGGAPVAQSTAELETFLDFSDSTKGGKRPVVIFQHGLGGDKDGAWGTAQRLASLSASGVAVFAIDSPEHGSRAPAGSTSTLISSVYGFFGIDPKTQGFDIERARDNFRQMSSDQLELVRFIESLGQLDLLPLDANGKSAPDGVPDLDLSHILYIGHSFGSVQGATLFALAPEITDATWNVGGDGLTTLLRDSGLFNVVVKGMVPNGTPYGAVARFFAVSQVLVDPGDPLNYAPNATLEPLDGVSGWKPRDVLLQEVQDDNIVPNSSSEALARALGLELVHPVHAISGVKTVKAPVTGNLPTGGTGVVTLFDLIEGGKPATHGELIFSPEAQQQYVGFFKSGLTNAHATVTSPY
jgi:pimeloyl-ACP methyl ester carboxylesterase